MTLAQFAIAVGATPKWVQNAAATLRRRFAYTTAEAMRLGLARTLAETAGVPLLAADRMAASALEDPESRASLVAEAPDGSVSVSIDVQRYLSTFNVRLSRARAYVPRPRGRPSARSSDPLEAGARFGIDVSLIESSLMRTPEERVRLASDNAEFIQKLREGLR